MKTKIKRSLKNTVLYLSMFLVFTIISLSIFINYKKQIVDEHIKFLQAQIPDLHSQSLFILKEIRINSKYRFSIKIALKEFDPILAYLNDSSNNITEEDLITINDFLMEELKTPNMLLNKDFERLSPSSKENLLLYRVKSFQNKLIIYLYQSKVGYQTCFASTQNWSLLDFWSKENYHIYLSYQPSDTFETQMTINGKERNENAILFGPQKTGIHTFDISLSHFDENGIEKKMNFTKKFEVLP